MFRVCAHQGQVHGLLAELARAGQQRRQVAALVRLPQRPLSQCALQCVSEQTCKSRRYQWSRTPCSRVSRTPYSVGCMKRYSGQHSWRQTSRAFLPPAAAPVQHAPAGIDSIHGTMQCGEVMSKRSPYSTASSPHFLAFRRRPLRPAAAQHASNRGPPAHTHRQITRLLGRTACTSSGRLGQPAHTRPSVLCGLRWPDIGRT